MAKFAQFDFSKLLKQTGAVRVSQSPRNGQACVLEIVSDGDGGEGLVKLQVCRHQDMYGEFRRITVRMPWKDGVHVLHAYYDGTQWHHAIKPVKDKQELFGTVHFPKLDITPLELPPQVVRLRAIVRASYRSEGDFLDWLAYKHPLEIHADALAELTEEQAAMILRTWELHGTDT